MLLCYNEVCSGDRAQGRKEKAKEKETKTKPAHHNTAHHRLLFVCFFYFFTNRRLTLVTLVMRYRRHFFVCRKQRIFSYYIIQAEKGDVRLMHTFRLKLKTTEADEYNIERRFRAISRVHNILVRECIRRLNRLKQDLSYRVAKAEYAQIIQKKDRGTGIKT